MHSLRMKLFCQSFAVVVVLLLLLLLLNWLVLPRYLLHQKKALLEEVATQIETMNDEELAAVKSQLAERYGVTIVQLEPAEADEWNWNLREGFRKQGVALNRIWLTEESRIQLATGTIHRLYSQDKLKSSFLVMYVQKGETVFAFGAAIADSAETLQEVNRFQIGAFGVAALITLLLSTFAARRIVRPLEELERTTRSIAARRFCKAAVSTGDEMESLARSINEMSDALADTQRELEEKNKNLQRFIADVSHELKTPLALIKAYAVGLEDGLDDGRFRTVIRRQVDELAELVDRLLQLARLQQEECVIEEVSLRSLLAKALWKNRLAFRLQQRRLRLSIVGERTMLVSGDRRKLELVLGNLISNATRYADDAGIAIAIDCDEQRLHFSIRNRCAAIAPQELERLCEPFYVRDEARSKACSGSGLGLAITKTALAEMGAALMIAAERNEIVFSFSLTRIGKL